MTTSTYITIPAGTTDLLIRLACQGHPGDGETTYCDGTCQSTERIAWNTSPATCEHETTACPECASSWVCDYDLVGTVDAAGASTTATETADLDDDEPYGAGYHDARHAAALILRRRIAELEAELYSPRKAGALKALRGALDEINVIG